mgnify:CR=1 FL=1
MVKLPRYSTRGNKGRILHARFSCQRDGLTIRGQEYRPQGEGLPAAIVCHGFMANMGSVRHYAQHLARKGFAAFCFDFCGGSALPNSSDGKTTQMSVLTEVDDLTAVVQHVRGLGHVDPTRLLLMGCSQGGFVSALVAAQLPKQVAALVLLYPAFCIPDDARSGKMMFARFDPTNVPETFRCGPMRLGSRYVTDVLDMDPYARIAPYAGPVLIEQGTADKIVDPSYALCARDTYAQRAGTSGLGGLGSITLHLIEGGAHGFSRKHDSIVIAHIDDFISPLL